MSDQRLSIWLPSTPSDARAVSVLHCGFLLKKGERNVFSWKNRYFTLKSNGDLVYCENTTSVQSIGSVSLNMVSVCTQDPKSPVHFSVQSAPQARKYFMKANSAEECTAWVAKISVRVF